MRMSKKFQKSLIHYFKGTEENNSEINEDIQRLDYSSNNVNGIFFVYQNEYVSDIRLFNLTPDYIDHKNGDSESDNRFLGMKRKITENLKEIYIYKITTVNRTYFVPYYIKWFYSKMIGFLSLDIEEVNDFSTMINARKWLEQVSEINMKDMSFLEEKLWKSEKEFQIPAIIGLEINQH